MHSFVLEDNPKKAPPKSYCQDETCSINQAGVDELCVHTPEVLLQLLAKLKEEELNCNEDTVVTFTFPTTERRINPHVLR
jgi:hypothetical protein